MKTLIRLFTYGTLLGACALVAWLTAQSLEPDAGAEVAEADVQPRYYLQGADWVNFDENGAPLSHVRAARIDYYDDQSARLTDLQVDRLGGAGSPWHLASPRGYAPPAERRLRLEEAVTVGGAWPDGAPLQLSTTGLWVDADRRELYTEAPVRVEGGTRLVDALGFRTDWQGDRVELLGEVKVIYEPG